MAAYFTGGGCGAGTDVVQAGNDGLQTLYLMNPSYVGYSDATPAASMMLFDSAVSSLTPASFGNQPAPVAQHFVGIPLQSPPSGYNPWGPDNSTVGGGGGMSPPRQQQAVAGTSAVSPVLSLSSREAPPVTLAAVRGTEGKYTSAPSQEQVVMRSKYLKAAQELLDEAVSVSKGVEEAKSAMAVKKKEDSEGASGGGGAEDGDGSKGGGAVEMSAADRQELQTKKSKLVNMLHEVEQRYKQYHRQMQPVASSFEAAAGPGSAKTYTSLALRTISRQFRCLRDAIAAQVRSACRALGEDYDAEDGGGGAGRTAGSRLRFIDHQLRQQRALQQLGMVHGGGGGGAWRPQRGLPEGAVSVLRAWLFEHFLQPYPKDSDKVMLAKQTGLTRSQVSNWFINARVRLWKPMVEEMYAEETKGKDPDATAGAGGGSGSNNTDGIDSVAEAPKPDGVVGVSSPSTGTTTSGAARVAGGGSANSKAGVHASLLELAGNQQVQASFYGGGGGDDASFQHRLKKARTVDEAAAAFHVSDVATLQAQAAAAAATRQQHDEAVSHRELFMKFMEAGGSGGASGTHPHIDDDVAVSDGYSLFTPAPYGQFGSEQFAFAGHGSGGVSLTLGLVRGAEQTPASLLVDSTNGRDGGAPVTTASYDMNMQSTKSFAAQLMRDFVA
ncbi:hypothetical protein ABZP36_010295 [Zizania latifolia]